MPFLVIQVDYGKEVAFVDFIKMHFELYAYVPLREIDGESVPIFKGMVFIEYNGNHVFHILQQVPLPHKYLKSRTHTPVIVSDSEFIRLQEMAANNGFDDDLTLIEPLGFKSKVLVTLMDKLIIATVLKEKNGRVLMAVDGKDKVTIERDRADVVLANMTIAPIANAVAAT